MRTHTNHSDLLSCYRKLMLDIQCSWRGHFHRNMRTPFIFIKTECPLLSDWTNAHPTHKLVRLSPLGNASWRSQHPVGSSESEAKTSSPDICTFPSYSLKLRDWTNAHPTHKLDRLSPLGNASVVPPCAVISYSYLAFLSFPFIFWEGEGGLGMMMCKLRLKTNPPKSQL